MKKKNKVETYIKVSKEELNSGLIKKLISLLSGVKNPDITIRIADNANENYIEKLEESIKQFERGEVISFTMEELVEYSKTPK